MIIVGSRNGRKGLGFSSGSGMEETGLEEGEACSFEDEEESIDPDVALSYIDEKVHNVLGHFQKDFEGGVSAENLGAKFGGYGSFLPTYQRSPGFSHPRIPAKSSQQEGGHPNSVLFTSAHLAGHGTAAINIVTRKTTASPSLPDSSKRETSLEITNRSANPLEQKSLKVRIKVGSDNLSPQNNAAIYSGLGLDVSPSSSLEDGPTESEAFFHEPQDVPDKSPNSILQIMTSFPVNGGLLLSPLPVELIWLTKKEKLLKGSIYGYISDGGCENSVMLLNGFDSLQKKVRPTEKNNILREPKKVHNKDRPSSTDWINKKELDIDTLAFGELVSNALKLPLLSNSYDTDVSIEAHKDLLKDDHHKEEKSSDSIKGHSIPFKGRKDSINETIDPLKQKTGRKTTVQEQNGVALLAGKDHRSSGRERKSKENNSQDPLAVEIPKEQSVSKTKKGPLTERNLCKSESENLRLHKDFGRASDRYREFFGDNPLEPQENEVDSVEIPLRDRSIVKNIEKLSTTEAYPKASSNSIFFPGKGPIYDAHATVDPIDNNDNWVCCDKCQKWRLLPIVKNLESLPEKWLCSMLNWLPGMNRCSFSEDDTTKAVVALNQSSHAQTQNNRVISLDGIVTRVTPSAVHNTNQNRQSLGFLTVPGEAKKKHETKEITETMNQDNPTQFPGFMRNLPPTVKSRSLNEVSESPLASEVDFKQLWKSSDSDTENHRNRKREKSKVVEQYPDEGNTNNSKMKIKRENDQDSFGASKKAKNEFLHHYDDWKPESGGAVIKTGPSLSSGLTTDAAENDQSNYTDRSSSKDSKSEEKDYFRISVKKQRVQVSLDDSSLDSKQCGNMDIAAKKRKLKECNDNQEHYESLWRIPENNGDDSIIAKENCKAGQKDNTRKDLQREKDLERDLTQPSLDGMDYLKRDLGSSQRVAATSSSSMVSGSHKSKTILQEVKGSPVESVSSSPLKVLKVDKLSSGIMNLLEKADLQDACFFTNTSSPRRGSEGEVNHVSQLGSARKEKSFSITQHGFHESDGHDFQNRDISHVSNSKTKKQVVASQEVTNRHFLNGSADTSVQYFNKKHASDQPLHEGRGIANNYTDSHSGQSGKGSSSSSKDKNKSTKSKYNKHKNTDSSNASQDRMLSYQAKSKHGKNNVEKRNVYNRDSGGKFSDVKLDCSQDAMQTVKQNSLPHHDEDRSSKVFSFDYIDHKETILGRGRSAPLPPLGRGKKVNGTGKSCVASECDDAIKGQHQTRKAENENGGVQINMRRGTPNLQKKVRDIEAPSPSRLDSSSHSATNAMKEAKDLKHLADRLKNSASNLESTGLYFQAALKFLHGASLLNFLNCENSKNGDQSMQIYSSTAKLCQFCAHEYERSKNMAGAALAYKCMEVAYMRVIYSSHTSASRDQHELQSVLQIVPPGDSTFSSCDIDGSNNVPTMDKVSIAKGVSPLQVAGNHVIVARNRPSFVRLLNFVQNVNFAMEASRKSWNAFGAANLSLDTPQHKEIISSIKRALDFNFHDIEGLLRLVRLAMDAISR